MAIGFPTKANWAAGDVLTASALDDLAGTVNTVQYLKPWNTILNSNMSVWQRGTSISLAASTGYASGYTADRWNTSTGANQATTVARYATSDTTNLPNIQYCMRFQRNSGQTGTTTYTLTNNFESVNSVPYAGKTVTYSFYARAGADYSATSKALTAIVFTGTGTDQNVQSGYTGQATPINSTATLTTTWQRFTFTATLASNITQIGTSFQFAPTGTAGTNDYFEITGVQLEQGSVANTYQPNEATYEAELAACQRYYWRDTGASNSPTIPVSYQVNSLTIGGNNPVVMRVAPSFSTTATNSTFGTSWSLSQPTRAASSKTGSISNNYFTTPLTWAVCWDGGTFTPSPTAFQGSSSNYFEANAEL
jgi:hypothetical protein